MNQHIAIKLTAGGGPEPQDEIRRIYEASQDDENGTSWIATRKLGASFSLSPNSQLLAFTILPKAEAYSTTGRMWELAPCRRLRAVLAETCETKEGGKTEKVA